MIKFLSQFKKFAAISIAALCFLAAPLAACGKNSNSNNLGGNDTPGISNPDIPGGDIGGNNPDNPIIPDVDPDIPGGDIGGNGDNNPDLPDVDPDNPVIPDPDLPDDVQNPFIDKNPNDSQLYDNVEDWSVMNLGGPVKNFSGDQFVGDYFNKVWSNDDIAEGWRNAVLQSIKTTQTVLVKLHCDWTASEDFFLGTSFGSGAGFGDYNSYAYGPIKVPVGASIILDLNGHKIDRNLSYSASTSPLGMVILVNGNLLIQDSNPSNSNSFVNPTVWDNYDYWGNVKNGTGTVQGGLITGGMNERGGGIYIGQLATATCVLQSGNIAGNYATNGGSTGVNSAGHGGGVTVASGASFLMTGGKI